MATLRDVLYNTLTADTALMAVLTGGVFDANHLGREGLKPDAVRDTTTQRIKPLAVIRWTGEFDIQPEVFNSEVVLCTVWYYEDRGFVNIQAAKRRIKQLIHNQYFTADDVALAEGQFADGGGEFTATEFGSASGDFSNFQFTTMRK